MDAKHADAPLTDALSAFVAGFEADALPADAAAHMLVCVRDAAAALVAATNPEFSTARLAGAFAREIAGRGRSTLVGQGTTADCVTAALVNGTLAYACDFEPSNTKGLLHSVAAVVPAALAVGEDVGADGKAFLAAVALGCEVAYRVSRAIGPAQQYALGFHPSALCGGFGAAAAAAWLLKLDAEAVARAFGLAACQASGLMAWESDPTENSRPFQIGVAARNGVTAARLAALGFGGPAAIFDHGHTVFHAFSRASDPGQLTADLGREWEGVRALKLKPYPCVSFLHPGLDALFALMAEARLGAADVAEVILHFARSGVHCIDANPLRSHCAQYVIPVAIANGALRVADLFEDRRLSDPRIADLGRHVRVVADDGELERLFGQCYATVVEIRTRDGRTLERRNDFARGNRENPLAEAELLAKFRDLAGSVAPRDGVESLLAALAELPSAPSLGRFAALLRAPPAR